MSDGASQSCGGVPPRLAPSTRFPVGLAIGLGALAAIGVAVLFWFNPTQSHFYPVCVFYQVTGLLCPGCGGLRAAHQLLHGHLLTALRCNLLLVLSLPLGGLWAWRFFRARGSAPRLSSSWLWLALWVLVLFGVLRNLPVMPFTWLAP